MGKLTALSQNHGLQIQQSVMSLILPQCSVFGTIFGEVLEVGVMFLPGADLIDAVDTIISTVKTFDQNVLSPTDYFNQYLGSKCGINGITTDPYGLFGMLAGASNGLGTSRGCFRKNIVACAQPKDNPAPAPDAPRSPAKDPWDGETPPTNDVPSYCVNTARLLRGRASGSKCQPIPDVEASGYTYEDKSTSGQYGPGTWAIQSPDKWVKTNLNDVAIIKLTPESGTMTVEYAYLTSADTVKTLKLRDMVCSICHI